MSPRTVRTVRTVIEVLLAVASAIPTVLAGADWAAAAQVVAVAGVVTHYFYLLEQLPFFPAALRVAPPGPAPAPPP